MSVAAPPPFFKYSHDLKKILSRDGFFKCVLIVFEQQFFVIFNCELLACFTYYSKNLLGNPLQGNEAAIFTPTALAESCL